MSDWLPARWSEGAASFAVYGAVISVVLLVLGLIALPLIVARLPSDYFSEERVSRREGARNGLVRVLSLLVRNVLGLCLLLAGVLMLVLPGQGILTLLAGLFLVDFPAKRRLMRRAFENEKVRRALDFLRSKMNKEPFER